MGEAPGLTRERRPEIFGPCGRRLNPRTSVLDSMAGDAPLAGAAVGVPGRQPVDRYLVEARRRGHSGLGVRICVVVLLVTLVTIAGLPLFPSIGPAGANGQSRSGPDRANSGFSVASSATVSVNPASGRVGWYVELSGGGFTPSALLYIYFNGTSVSELLLGSCTSNSGGSFFCTIQVPALPAGPYDLNVTDFVHNGSAAFTILPSVLSLSPVVGYVSSNATANGSGFEPDEPISLTFSGTSITSCLSGSSLLVDNGGNFSCTFAVPALPAGVPYPVDASDGINTASATYTINRPTLSLSPTSGNVGSKVTATGVGFSAGGALTITFGTTSISRCSSGSTSANPFGDLSCSFPVPVLAAGTYLVNVSDDVNSASPASFVVGPPFLSLSVTHGPVGTSTTATGSGFTPSGPVTLEFNSTSISACTSGQLLTDSSGDFSCTFAIPASPSGSQTVRANDTVNSASATFTVIASLTLSQPNGSFGDVIAATGTGFNADASVAVAWNSTSDLCTTVTGGNGSFSCSFLVPSTPAGSYTVTATEGQLAPTASFQVDPTVVLSSNSRVVGQPEVANGYGFEPLLSISILWDHVTPECGGSSTHSDGSAACDFLVPAVPGGEHTVSFVQGALQVNRSLTVTSAFSIHPQAGVVGLNVQLVGTGFEASTVYLACLETSLVSCPSGSPSFTTASNGSIPTDTNFTVPPASPGSYDLVVSTGTSIAGEAGFTVTTATVNLTPTKGPVGTPVNLSGSGFAPDTAYAYCFQATATSCPSSASAFTSTASGNVPSGLSPILVPPGPSDVYYVDVSQGTSLIGSGEFLLLPNLTTNRTLVEVGMVVEANGTGFPINTPYALMWNSSVSLCEGTTNSTGGFGCSFVVPPASRGAHKFSATAGTTVASATLTVTPSVGVSPASGKVGSIVQVTGAGFDSDAAYSILWISSGTVCSKWTNATGSLSCSFAIPASPAGARTISIVEGSLTVNGSLDVTPSLMAAPSSGTVGSLAQVTGMGLDAESLYTVLWNASTLICSGSTNGTGGFECAFSVPLAPGGPNTIVTDEGSYTPSVDFTVLPSVEISPTEGPVGSQELAMATGFAARASYSFRWNISTLLCSGSATSNGGFDCSFTVPAAPAGVYTPTAIEGGSSLSTPFAIVPSFVVSRATGYVNTVVQVSGTGFDADSSFTLAWNSTTQVCSGTTSWNGNLTCDFLVPNSPGGSHTLVLTEGSHSLTTSFTILPFASVSRPNGTNGTTVTVGGTGFAPYEPYVVTLAPTGGTVCAGEADSNGAFECSFVVPAVPPGTYTLTVSQGTTALSFTFFVETPPPGSSPSAPFPWWLVGVLVVAALVGALVIYQQSRRQRSARARTVRPWAGSGGPSGTPGVGGGLPPDAGQVAQGPATGPPFATTAGAEGGAEKLFRRLVPVYREVLKAPPPPGAYRATGSETPGPTNEVDVLVARLGRIYEEALSKRSSSGSSAGAESATPVSAEEVRAHITRLAPIYRDILKEKPPSRSK